MADISKLAKRAWDNYCADRKNWQQSLEDEDGDRHYCLSWSYNKTVIVHGIWDRNTGNYRVIRFHFDDAGNIIRMTSNVTGKDVTL